MAIRQPPSADTVAEWLAEDLLSYYDTDVQDSDDYDRMVQGLAAIVQRLLGGLLDWRVIMLLTEHCRRTGRPVTLADFQEFVDEVAQGLVTVQRRIS